MTERTCTVMENGEHCDKPHRARGYCKLHWQRWRKHGDPLVVLLKDKTKSVIMVGPRPDDCWLCTGAGEREYGRITLHDGRRVYAHRNSYEEWIGPIPPGYEIDHKCFNKACCNPRHLRLATDKQQSENRRGALKNSKSGVLGVSWCPDIGKWRAVVNHNGKYICVGRFVRIEDAEAARIAKACELFTHNDVERKKLRAAEDAESQVGLW